MDLNKYEGHEMLDLIRIFTIIGFIEVLVN